ncbi:adenylate/guanylate cyclase domain-containing protein [Luminiphilus sp.]|nr:adenylate/guanylate cyclase domain-containing protein [Luminiphilus sp.]
MSSQETKFVERDGVRIAYRIYGHGTSDLIIVPGIISHVEFAHELPGYSEFISAISKHHRVIVFDKRGNGLSQKLSETAPTIEQRMDDIRFVMDDVDSKQATVLGVSEGGSLSALFAAMYPERTKKLILFGAFARTPGLEKLARYPRVLRSLLKNIAMRQSVRKVKKTWGDGSFFRSVIPSDMLVNGRMRQQFKDYELASTNSEDMAKMMSLLSEMDVTSFLNHVRCPTLVMHSHDDRLIPFKYGQELHDGIQGSELLELTRAGHTFFMSRDKRISAEILDFLADGDKDLEAKPQRDRVLATIMFNDIVGSTKLQTSFGDEGWAEKVRKFEALNQELISDYDGVYVKGLGDGVLAFFSGPTRAIKCAFEIKEKAKDLGIQLRTGLHIGEIEKDEDDVRGINVNAAARIQGKASADQVLVSDVLRNITHGSGVVFEDAGDFELDGFQDRWRLSRATQIEH